MKQVFAQLGGRPFANDDLVTLQQELTDAVQAQFLGHGPFVLAGCAVSGNGPAYNVAAGIVCLDGQLLRFAGGGAVTLPAQLQAGPAVLSDPRPYQTGGTKSCMREVPAVLVASNPTYTAGEFLPLDTWGGKRWDDVVRASVRSLSEVQYVASLATTDYDGAGLGKPGTEAWGWGLCNGEGGRADLRGMFVVGVNPDRFLDTAGRALTTTAIGNQGGEETHVITVPEMPAHTHGLGAVTDNQGVTRAGDTLAKSYGSAGGLDYNRRTAATGGAGGTTTPHNNMPPFYALGVRQWVGY